MLGLFVLLLLIVIDNNGANKAYLFSPNLNSHMQILQTKKLFFIVVLSFLIFSNIEAQEKATGTTHSSFVEWNFGIALVGVEDSFPFPGTSVLWGRTHTYENNLIFEYEVGMALPSVVTGKLGIGKKFNTTKVIVGVRPFPFNLYLQSSFTNKKKGYWIASIEYNPLNIDTGVSLASKAILNFGYRWNINKEN